VSSSEFSLARSVRLAGVLAVLAAGCVTDLRVGIEQIEPDASVVSDETDAGEDPQPQPCVQSDCGPEPTGPSGCELYRVPRFECERDAGGVCTWQVVACSDPNAPCEEIDCQGPLLTNPAELVCSDGTEPMCKRDPATGLCSFQCEAAGACGTEAGKGCPSGQYCWFREGLCGVGSGGQCTTQPSECNPSVTEESVCGCDGTTYASPCEAAKLGVNIAFAGACSASPGLCEECVGAAPDPAAIGIACDDGVHMAGPNCIHGGDGMCHWQWLACPSTRSCASEALLPIEPGRCFDADDCPTGQTCEGASLCPCDAECFAPETPGYCKSP
jgi:hypothetical protein